MVPACGAFRCSGFRISCMVQYDNYRPSYERARARTLGGVLIRDMPPPVVRFIIRRPEFLVCLFLFMALRNSGYVVPDITGGYSV